MARPSPNLSVLRNIHPRFIQELRDTCLDETPGNRPFWDAVKGVGRPLSFISASEASKAGGQSEISESEAQKVSFALQQGVVDTISKLL